MSETTTNASMFEPVAFCNRIAARLTGLTWSSSSHGCDEQLFLDPPPQPSPGECGGFLS